MLATIHPSAHSPALTLHTYNGQELHPQIPVSLPPTLTAPEFLSLFSSPTHHNPAYTFPALQNWFARTLANFALQDDEAHPFHKHPYKLRELDVQAVDWFWRGRAGYEDKLGFMKIQARIETDAYIHDGEEKARADWLPGALFLRGGSVAVLIIVQPEDVHEDEEKFVILTVQPRVAAGSLGFTEIPAGMLDGSSFKGSAASEIEEEAGLKVEESDLVNMTELALEDVMSPNLADSQENSGKTTSQKVPFSHAVTYMNRVKDRYESQPDVLQKFMDILHAYRQHSKPVEDVYHEIHHLFSYTPDLIQDFKVFLPQSHEAYQPTVLAAQKHDKARKVTKGESLDNAIYPSVGACDEFIPIFLLQKRLTRQHMDWLKGKATGLRDEGENITLKLVPLSRAWKEGARDAKALAALALYENLKREGTIPEMPEDVAAEPGDMLKK